MSKIKVLVVDDSAFMRKVISDMIDSDQELEVIGTARNGKDALKKLEALAPDVITLDVEMPELDGLETLKRIQTEFKLPVIMLSSTTTAGAENTLIALEHGAFDFISKPSGPISLDLHKVQDELKEKVKLAYSSHQRNKQKLEQRATKSPTVRKTLVSKPVVHTSPIQQSTQRTRMGNQASLSSIILIGTSTGGPKALHQLLSYLPKLENVAILIVQHMPPGFTKSLANRLDQQTDHTVREGLHGEVVRPGHIYIAPGGYHMILSQQAKNQPITIELNQEPPVNGHRPSVNTLFQSAISIKQDIPLLTVVMTGMGKDGTEGLKSLAEAKTVYTLAEDESTCIVYGMPRAVVEAQLSNEVLPLHEIHLAIERWLIH
ncbi:protein-glutamate methylesterase/protein-glutamine glutaminase [Bacillus horti]|uniref:Protein-glutamate methylesterase/protein-glutamine glutaminase n=1 Tax=Caldalkalibacillus horti TaxID=77523 RepID=A0ABT9VUL4_9BACI|nr:chemotaxis response regulator protein-glutamate methylesterase [Bacillus horti]MDQ0164683.1 two-component system chemotaxis response regulator CheB [Bacillus horti]